MRNFYIVSYDISSDKLRNKVCKELLQCGERIQYSVFCCRLTANELKVLKVKLNKIICEEESAGIIFINVGPINSNTSNPDIIQIGKEWKNQSIGNVF